MLLHLCLRNYILTRHLEIEFPPGFCVLTGETGAGKSLLVGALALLAGDRSGEAKARRQDGGDNAEIEAAFSVAANAAAKQWLQDNALADDNDADMLLVRRVIGGGGRKSATFVNGRQTPLALAAEIVSLNLEICGQHAHYSLRAAAAHRDLLDSFAAADTGSVAAAYHRWRDAEKKHAACRVAQSQDDERRRILEADLTELTPLEFSDDKWRQTNDTLTKTTHAADLAAAVTRALQALAGDGGAQTGLSAARRLLGEMRRHDNSVADMLQTLNDADGLINTLTRELSAYGDDLTLEPEQQIRAEEYVGECHRLARKHGLADAALLGKIITDKQAELDALPAAADLEKWREEEEAARQRLRALCDSLGDKRRLAAKTLEKKVNALLRRLAMPKARFVVTLPPLPTATAHGAEKVLFQIATRDNMAAGDIAAIASGGELSRLGLAIQLAAGQTQTAAASVFDEVDAGVGGATAGVVGALLKSLGETRQVLCVTHLPQVAACAAAHWRVEDGMVVRRLSDEERIEEIARMNSGENITAAARAHAAEMLVANTTHANHTDNADNRV